MLPASKPIRLSTFGAGLLALALFAEANAGNMFSGGFNGTPVFNISMDLKAGVSRDIYVRDMLLDCIVTADELYVAPNHLPLIDETPPTRPVFQNHKGDFSGLITKATALFNRVAPQAKNSLFPSATGDFKSLNGTRAKEEAPEFADELRALQSQVLSVCAELSMKP